MMKNLKKFVFSVIIGVTIGVSINYFLYINTKTDYDYLTGENAIITFTNPIRSNNNFFLTTFDQQFYIIPNTFIPHPVDDFVEGKSNSSSEDKRDSSSVRDILSLGNSFFCDVDGKEFLCTAYHCVASWEDNFKEIKSYNKKICDDISLINYKSMVRDGKAPCFEKLQPNIYKTNFDFPNHDSIFIQGYFPDKNEQRIKTVMIKGIGVKNFKTSFSNPNLVLQDQMIMVKLGEKHIDLRGLSGSPAFNSKDEVVGVVSSVYTGLSINTDTTKACYLIISNFHH